ncbi:MAG: hypothetical protein AAF355_05200 [Myxococcota bacterium]
MTRSWWALRPRKVLVGGHPMWERMGVIGCRIGFLAFLVFETACGGPRVEPVDPRDLTLPVETRQWLAAAQDAVIAAEAREDFLHVELQHMERWADVVLESRGLDSARGKLNALAELRVELAELDYKIARAEVVLARRKLAMTYAERAVHHDLGSYDLEKLRKRVARSLEVVGGFRQQRLEAAQRVLRAGGEWWQAYATHAARPGATQGYWIGNLEPIQDVEQPPPEDASNAGTIEEADSTGTDEDADG